MWIEYSILWIIGCLIRILYKRRMDFNDSLLLVIGGVMGPVSFILLLMVMVFDIGKVIERISSGR